tara:strand:+ start:1835 stop:2488 length:654 start_codon:yes stop_codon:yes gene_type:complete
MILNIYKPVNWTSFEVVKKVRKIINEKKVGHGGTLDPFAEGVLIIGTGKDTKKLTSITNNDKSYIATIKLGVLTDTLDTEGEIIQNKTIPKLDSEKVKDILKQFLGESYQIPPMYSAKKINGKRLYELARKNIKIKRKPIKIDIKDIDLIDFKNNTITFSITCSKGTYIRVLGKDIAEKLDTVGYLIKLIRTNVGTYNIKESQSIMNFEKAWKLSEI